MSSTPLPRLRDDLRITPHNESKAHHYIIEDPLRNAYFKIGHREYQFLCRLAAAPYETGSSPKPLAAPDMEEDEAMHILQWLAAKQLLQNPSVETLETIRSAELTRRRKSILSRYNPIIFRIPLFNPDPLLDRSLPLVSWLAGPFFLVVWLLFGVAGCATLLANWEPFVSESSGFFSPRNIMIVGIIWVMLKLLHECSHAITCKRYGGGVYEFGILFILFIPLTYINASSSWGFATRWQRIHVAAAGMYMELFIAWAALLYWTINMGSPEGLIAHNTVLVAGMSSLLFNANPLMRFDGYYILSDLTATPNLYFRGLHSVNAVMRKWWLGIDDPQAVNESPLIIVYGCAVYCWRILVLVSLTYLASKMLSGWGIILAIVAVVGWLYSPLSDFLSKIPDYQAQNPGCLPRLISRMALVVLLSSGCLFGVTWSRTISVPAVVLFEEEHVIRPETTGFIDKIFVSPGDMVEKGDQLITLHNDDLASELQLVHLELEKLELQRRSAQVLNRQNEIQILEERRKVLRTKLEILSDDMTALTIHAPAEGTIVGQRIVNRLGTMAHKGEALFLVVNPSNKHLAAAVDQDNFAAIQAYRDTPVKVDMSRSGIDSFTGTITRISPQASRELIHFSLSASAGGPFDVKPTMAGGYQLFSPSFTVYIAIPETIRPQLRDGQQAIVRFDSDKRSIAHHLWQDISSWFLARQSHDSS